MRRIGFDRNPMRSLCLVICFLVVVTGEPVSPRRRLASPDLRITMFAIAEDIGFPHVYAESWVGHAPCHHWYGVDCIDGSITTITFMNSNLTGFISHRFAELASLNVIDLSHNRLTGTIPIELLTKFKNRSILDVSYNNLHGKVPEFRKEVVYAEGNPHIEKDVISRHYLIGIGIGIGFMLAGGITTLSS